MTRRKIRSDAKLAQLTAEQREALVAKMLNGMSPQQARAWAKKEHGVQAGLSAFYAFWHSDCVPVLLARRQMVAKTADTFGKQAAADNAAMDRAFVTQLKQMGYELALRPNADPQEVFFVLGQVLKLRDQEQKERDREQKGQQFTRAEELKRAELEVKRRLADLAERRVVLLESKLQAVTDAVEKAKKPGGLTPEALREIEQAAKIL